MVTGLAVGLLLAAGIATTEAPEEPNVHPTWPWVVTQLVPSPELAGGRHAGPRFGLRWQVTPLLYSWGVHRGLSPWRYFVAEPFVRQSGSIELYFTPEYFPGFGRSFGADWMARTGVRTYLPLVAHGESLSMSIGASHFYFEDRSGAAFEAGVYTFSGIVGVQITASASPGPFSWIATLRLRYF